ncbi:MAG: GIY-YIG nuclease family protein [Rubrivivax sp.]|nr:GIY-YIG nuclease family protein [Rubrivivax sp.]
MSAPFSLRIFVADGDPDGLRVVERSNWIGKALIFPRALLPRVKQRDELGQTGVYLLLGPRDDGEGEKLYIGEGGPIRPRLESHYAQKDFWTRAVCFVGAPDVFTSPSTAAAVLLGRSANGRNEWKDAQGRPLKELQAQEATV